MKFFAKFFGYLGGGAMALGQTGLLGAKWSSIATGVGAVSLGVAAHAASNSGPTD
jgi:hypothetical protein